MHKVKTSMRIQWQTILNLNYAIFKHKDVMAIMLYHKTKVK